MFPYPEAISGQIKNNYEIRVSFDSDVLSANYATNNKKNNNNKSVNCKSDLRFKILFYFQQNKQRQAVVFPYLRHVKLGIEAMICFAMKHMRRCHWDSTVRTYLWSVIFDFIHWGIAMPCESDLFSSVAISQ